MPWKNGRNWPIGEPSRKLASVVRRELPRAAPARAGGAFGRGKLESKGGKASTWVTCVYAYTKHRLLRRRLTRYLKSRSGRSATPSPSFATESSKTSRRGRPRRRRAREA